MTSFEKYIQDNNLDLNHTKAYLKWEKVLSKMYTEDIKGYIRKQTSYFIETLAIWENTGRYYTTRPIAGMSNAPISKNNFNESYAIYLPIYIKSVIPFIDRNTTLLELNNILNYAFSNRSHYRNIFIKLDEKTENTRYGLRDESEYLEILERGIKTHLRSNRIKNYLDEQL
jgi:hypothetical protein